jgi:pimeloyl-ACP methyl ester carboxylesterase
MVRTTMTPLLCITLALFASRAHAQQELVFLDSSGVVRWHSTKQEVSLFGANYVLTTASDYRAAGYVHGDRKKMIDEDMAHFARMGWDALRLTFWGDWESADSAGNLIANDHLDLLDYLIARARERGIYMLFSPIQLYGSNWPDALASSPPGFGRHFGKARMGTDSGAIAAQVNYLRQILTHVNPYTKVAIKDEPSIIFVELVNEPWHHPEDLPGSIRYINALTDAVRSTGCTKLIFYNISQDFRIGEAIRQSKAQGITFGWYPTGLNSGRELVGNYLRGTDAFPDIQRTDLARLPRIVYEFDAPDLREATMYPAMTRTFRTVGTQFAAMFAYDMLATASRNLGWQTHNLNLVYTPRKAMSTVIAAEEMRRLPRGRSYGSYPENTRFGDFRISYESDLAELVARDAFLYAGSTTTKPPQLGSLRRIAGYGSSPVVSYGGEGVYFLDRIRKGVWRLEVYPDAVPVRDPFELPRIDKIVTRAISRSWPMTVTLPELGESFTVQPVTAGQSVKATAGRFDVMPGVYVLSVSGVDLATMPAKVGQLGFKEYHAPPLDTVPLTVVSFAQTQYLTGRDAEVRVRIVDRMRPDSARLYFRRSPGGSYQQASMRPGAGYEFTTSIPSTNLQNGLYQFVITVFRGDTALTFPAGTPGKPTDWNYNDRGSWRFDVISPATALRLFDPGPDASRLAFTRIGDAGRRGLFRNVISPITGQPVFHFELPRDTSGWSPADYTASLVVKERVEARQETIVAGNELRLRLRGLGSKQTLHVTLMEDDGTSWTAPVVVDSAWSEQTLALSDFKVGRGVLLPQGFPGEWNYWVGPATGRGGATDKLRLQHLERLQFSVRRDEGRGIEVEWVTLQFGTTAVKTTMQVRVPEGTGTVYLAGSLNDLGPWRPDGRALTGTGRSRTVQVSAPAGTTFEYKFTLGTWDREALSATGVVPPNNRLMLSRDTVVAHEIAQFKKDVREYVADWRGSGVLGRLVYWPDVNSTFLGSPPAPHRLVEIWLPPGYDSSTTTRYPVLYMHDGQNLFDPRIASTGTDWGVDEAIMRLVKRGVMPPVIVVGVWNSARRGAEYSPWRDAPQYARFMIEELMPRVNATFRTLTGPQNTATMGSSMGGLLSFYLVTHHPEAFGACGCISTHFPLSQAVVQQFFTDVPKVANPDTTPYIVRDIAAGLEPPKGARYWFDFGGHGLDSAYAPSHEKVRQWLLKKGLKEGTDFVIRRYPEATHNEASWRARLEDPLTFLFGKP